MARTLIVIDPMGFNLTALGLQYLLLKGTLVRPGDTVYRLPYVNTAGIEYINHGVDLLDDKLNSTAGEILVFAYSEGAQVATKWLRTKGHPAPVTPTSRLSFLFIGNAERRYGGFAYKHSTFDEVADTEGLPEPLEDGTSTVHYEVTDFARQYDGVADFPNAPDIQQAIESVGGVTTDPLNWILRALQDVANALIGNYKDAALNAILGMNVIHNNYFLVTPDDLHNVRFTDPDHPSVEYVWSPTYPVPMLGIGSTFPSLDRDKRKSIETAYSRPVTLPSPNYAQISLFTTDFFATDADYRAAPDQPGWFPESRPIHVSVSLVVSPSLSGSAIKGSGVGSVSMSVAPTLSAYGVGLSRAAATLLVSPSLAITSAPHVVGAIAMSVSPSLSVQGFGTSIASVSLAVSPALSVEGVGSVPAGYAALAVSPSLSAEGFGTSKATAMLAVSPSLSAGGAGESTAAVTLSVAPDLVVGGSERYTASADLSAQVKLAAIGRERYRRTVTLAVSPGLVVDGAELYAATAELAVSPGLSVTGEGRSTGAVALTVSPNLGVAADSRVSVEIPLVVTPSLSATGGERYGGDVDLPTAPALTVTGSERYARTVTLPVSPGLGVDGVGHDGEPVQKVIYVTGLDSSNYGVLVGIGNAGESTLVSENPSGPGYLANFAPYYPSVDPATGDVYAPDTYNLDLMRFDGSTASFVGVSGLNQPIGSAVAPAGPGPDAGTVLVTDPYFQGGILITWHPVNGQSYFPTGVTAAGGVAFDSAGNMYVTDAINGSITTFDFVNAPVTEYLSGVGQLVGIAVAPDGTQYVADVGNGTVISWDGTTQTTLPLSGVSASGSIAVDEDGIVYIVDYDHGQIVTWDGTTQSTLTHSLSVVIGVAAGSS